MEDLKNQIKYKIGINEYTGLVDLAYSEFQKGLIASQISLLMDMIKRKIVTAVYERYKLKEENPSDFCINKRLFHQTTFGT